MIRVTNRIRAVAFWPAVLGAAFLVSPVAQAATAVVINNDGAGEGFNDPTAAAPVGGNSGTTIGAQRLIAFQRAADIWASRLRSNVTIRIQAQFNPLSCSTNSAVLGSAGAWTNFRDTPGLPVASTWFPIALVNAYAGSDQDTANDDIRAQFNSNLGTAGCLASSGWYYGLDANSPSNRIDFISVLLHELGHGLGFASLVDLASGAKALGFNDTYMRFLENHGASPPDYPSMTNAQRVAASISTGNLHWTGANVRASSAFLSAGASGDHVRMFAPNPAQSGSSVSHFDTVLTPNQMMEPSYTVPIHYPILELPLFKDIGWTVTASTHDFNGNALSDILWRDNAGNLALWLMNGSAVASSVSLGAVPPSWQVVGQRDFDNDGRVDILWRDASGNVAIWFMNGATVKSSAGLGNVGGFLVAGTGDLDGDGFADIVWRDGSGNTAVWLMRGSAVQSAVSLGNVATSWSVVNATDFNADGKADLLWRNTSGAVAIWFMNGAAVSSSAAVGTVVGWSIVATGDFNGDGKADLLWRDGSGNTAVWLMNGATVALSGSLGSVPTSWSVPLTGDFGASGRSDILWHNTSGATAIWFMNGTTVSSSASLGTVAGTWGVQGVNAN